MHKKIIRLLTTGFVVLIAMMLLVQFEAVKVVDLMADSTKKLYQHPFAVSNSVLKANADIIAMHRYMKDVALAQNTKEQELAISLVDKYETKVYRHFDFIITRFLGDKARITKVRQSFVNWKPIRSEVINLTRAGKNLEAATMTKGKGAEYVARLTKEMNGLIFFAQNKAEEFVNLSQEQQMQSRTILYGLMSIIVIIGSLIAYFIIKRVRISSNKLKESEQRWHFALEGNRDGVWDWNVKTNQIFFSTRWKQMLGYNKGEIDNSFSEWENRVHPEDLEQALVDVDSHLKHLTPFYENEHRMKCKDGTYKWIQARGKVVSWTEDEKPLRMIGTHTDISERKKTQDQLRKLALAVEQSPENIIITNLDAEIEYVNEAFIRDTGYSREQIIGQNPRILQSGKTPDYTYKKMWEELVKGNPWKGEFYNKRQDGSEYIEFALIMPLHQPDGEVTHYVALKEDITEKKRLAKELDSHRHHLEELVAQRTEQLDLARQRAETANKAKSTFLANMSHEIRTPMNGIVGLTHLLLQADPMPEQMDRLIKIEYSASHLLEIINDVLDLSKIEAGKVTLEQSDFNLNMIFDNILSLFKVQADDKKLNLQVKLNSAPEWLRGDPTRLTQALINLVGNAIKYTEQGSIKLSVKKLEEQGDKVILRFEVEDTGIGIDPKKQSILFDAFEQADASTTRKYGGTGLGLAITRHIVQLMDGEIGVESKSDQGSIFWFTVKLSSGRGSQQVKTELKAKNIEDLCLSHFIDSRILVVEDNAINLEVALGLLKNVKITVDSAENGQQAVDKVSANDYDLILMDMQMPIMDGLEATRLIRLIPEKKNLPILAMTANIFEEDRLACMAAGMNDFVAKPIDPGNLYSMILKYLPKHKVPASQTSIPAFIPSTRTTIDEINLPDQLAGIEGLDSNIGLRNMSGDAIAYLRLIRQFDSVHFEDMDKLNLHCIKTEVESARAIAHTLKGAAGSLGLTQIQGSVNCLEQFLITYKDKESHDEVFQLINTVKSEQLNLRKALNNITLQSPDKQIESANPEQILEIVDRLKKLLIADNTAANEVFSDSQLLLSNAFGPMADQLGQQIEVYDYQQALKIINSISET